MKIMAQLMLALLMYAAPVPATGRDGVAPGGKVEIKQGKVKKVAGADLKITFLSVVEDSRCPTGVQCIWAGNARVRLRIGDLKGKRAQVELNTYSQPVECDFGSYKIRLTKLSPVPSIKGRPDSRDYTATLAVSKLKT